MGRSNGCFERLKSLRRLSRAYGPRRRRQATAASHHIVSRASASPRYDLKHIQGIPRHLGLLSLADNDLFTLPPGSETQLRVPDSRWRRDRHTTEIWCYRRQLAVASQSATLCQVSRPLRLDSIIPWTRARYVPPDRGTLESHSNISPEGNSMPVTGHAPLRSWRSGSVPAGRS